MAKHSFSWSNFFKPTPKLFKRIGNALVAVSATSIPAFFTDHHYLGWALLISGAIGRFLIEFFGENE